MYEYEMDPASTVEDTKQTQFRPQMYSRTTGQMDGRTGWHDENSISLLSTWLKWEYYGQIKSHVKHHEIYKSC